MCLEIPLELTIRRVSTKTDAGARIIPLNRNALAMVGTLRVRAERLGSAEPKQFVFPACENGKIEPLRPIKGWRPPGAVQPKMPDWRGSDFTIFALRQSRNWLSVAKATRPL
jgi:hypothetical protein